jgi:hypothetical protein
MSKNVLNQIKSLLGIEVKLEQMALDNGAVLEAEAFEPMQPVFIVNGEDRVAVPVGEYSLEDGRILVVETEGEIKEIKPKMEEVEETPEAEVEVEAEAQSVPKKVIESTVKESHFSKEEFEALKAENESLKTQLSAKVEVKEVVELSTEPLTHSPETKAEVKLKQYGANRPMTTQDRVFQRINQIKN